jgi:hypothetical protein
MSASVAHNFNSFVQSACAALGAGTLDSQEER